jgi:hypothetical protein
MLKILTIKILKYYLVLISLTSSNAIIFKACKKSQKWSAGITSTIYSSCVHIGIPASDVAAIIGENPYKTPNEVMEKLWEKYQKTTKTFKTDIEKALEIIERDQTGYLNNLLISSINTAKRATSSDQAREKLHEVVSKVDSIEGLNSNEKLLTKDLLRGSISTTFGVQSETKTAIKSQDLIATDGIKLVESKRTYSLPILKSDSYEFTVRGRIDRLKIYPDGSTKLVEIKNRINKLFKGTFSD